MKENKIIEQELLDSFVSERINTILVNLKTNKTENETKKYLKQSKSVH